VGLRASLDAVLKKSLLCLKLNPGHPSCSSVTVLTELFLFLGALIQVLYKIITQV
jgi:hypothetical protein